MKLSKPIAAALLFGLAAGTACLSSAFGQDLAEALRSAATSPAPTAGAGPAMPEPEAEPGIDQAGQQQPATQQPTRESETPLRVMTNKSILINTAERLKRVSITDPAIADAVVVSPNQVMIHGQSPGEVTLVVWDEQDRSRSFDLRVDVDSRGAAEEIKQLLPGEKINVTA